MKSHLFDNLLGMALLAWAAYQWWKGSVIYYYRSRGDSLEMCHQWVDREDHPAIFWFVLAFDFALALVLISV